MAKDAQVAIRMDPALVERAEALVPKLKTDRYHKAYRVSKAAVMRLAMEQGLALLEHQFEDRRHTRLESQLAVEVARTVERFVQNHSKTSLTDVRNALDVAQGATVAMMLDREETRS
jgi:Glu-tRNA(Gln) amidotransferase subunit E-like FAD-binding protein